MKDVKLFIGLDVGTHLVISDLKQIPVFLKNRARNPDQIFSYANIGMSWGSYNMPKPRRAIEKQIPLCSMLSYREAYKNGTSGDYFMVTLDNNGMFSRYGRYAGHMAVLIITKIQTGTTPSLLYSENEIDVIYEDVLDANGRFSRLGEHANKNGTFIIF